MMMCSGDVFWLYRYTRCVQGMCSGYTGTEDVFRGYGITCIFVAVGFFALNFFYISKLPPSQSLATRSNELTVETAYLAPHGVPGGGVTHSPSTSRLEKGKSVIQ